MKCFGLTPDDVLARTAGVKMRPVPSVPFAMLYGALSYGIVSVLAYSLWAYRLVPGGEGALYAAIAVVYLGLSGVALARLVAGPGAMGRFMALFGVAFAAYAIVWCLFWFGLRGKHHADLYGSAVGLALVVWLLQRAFGRRDGFLPLYAVLFACHTIGYTLGDDLHALVRGSAGRLLWGAGHGLGFGAGLGFVLQQCQEPLRRRLAGAA